MSAFWQFKALIRKNVLTLKRSVFTTLLEIFYPIILMLVGYLVELIFASKKFVFENEGGLDNYLIDKGNFGFDYNVYTHLAGIKMFENQEDYFNHIKDKIGNDELTKLRGKLLFIQSNLSPDNGVWKYVDPLNEVHDIPLSTISGLPNKPITMICYNRFSIAFVGFKEDDESGPGPTIKRYIEIEAQSLNRKYSIDDNITNQFSYSYINKLRKSSTEKLPEKINLLTLIPSYNIKSFSKLKRILPVVLLDHDFTSNIPDEQKRKNKSLIALIFENNESIVVRMDNFASIYRFNQASINLNIEAVYHISYQKTLIFYLSNNSIKVSSYASRTCDRYISDLNKIYDMLRVKEKLSLYFEKSEKVKDLVSYNSEDIIKIDDNIKRK